MTESNLLDTKTVSLGEIFGNGKIYKVPPFQRDYSWGEDQWDDLWTDVVDIYQAGGQHYMGAVVLQNKGNKLFLIIDGQQRFTTLSLLLLATIEKIKSLVKEGEPTDENKERVELLMSKFIGQKDPASLRYGSKLYLNENNDQFFQNRLVQFKPPILASKLNDSERLLWKAYQFFKERLDELFGDTPSGETLAKFLDQSIADRIMFIQIVVENELNAYTVFETLNARGVELTSTDLLKNYLFSLVARIESHIELVKAQWKKITDTVGMQDFPTFLRHFLNSRQELIPRDNLFKVVRQQVSSEEQVFALLDELEKYAYIHRALGSPYDDLWKEDKEVPPLIAALKLFRVTQFKPLLLVAYTHLEWESFKRVLNDVVVISFRYNIIAKRHAKNAERAFNKAANGVFYGTINSSKAVFKEVLNQIYIADEDFNSLFSTYTINTDRTKKLARYILYKLEGQIGGGKYDYETDEGTIEHILPENLSEDWSEKFTSEEHHKYAFAIGNLTLLEPKINRQIAQNPFAEKKLAYANSQYQLSKEINATDWTPKSIIHRQASLAKTAKSIWKVQY
ncbi:MAG: DUF262 domain-containing HNH endonuclease family protein [Saprospiraceae bacterium]|jgi:hypothetical protein|nr:DUF262 domain-containing HNH endonuclease family protein [Saprospiraceae bacterium]